MTPSFPSQAILYKIKMNQDVTTIPTVGFNVETIMMKNTKFNVWDVGGQDKIRPLWRHYYTGTQGLIFVVDSSDRARMTEAKVELRRIMNDDEMTDAILLVFANKQDVPGALKWKEVEQLLELGQYKNRICKVQESVATEGEGLVDGLVSCAYGLHFSPLQLCSAISAPITMLMQSPIFYLQEWISKNIIAKDKNDKKQRLDKVRDRTG
jgi:ADP-ribosylation factor 6